VRERRFRGGDAKMTRAERFANDLIKTTLLGGTGKRVKMGTSARLHVALCRNDD
jgi:hypothetical protein